MYKVRWSYYKLRQLSLLQSLMDSYYKLRQLSLLRSLMDSYYKVRQIFITEGDTDGQLLQIATTNLLQTATWIIKNCERCYKVRWSYYKNCDNTDKPPRSFLVIAFINYLFTVFIRLSAQPRISAHPLGRKSNKLPVVSLRSMKRSVISMILRL